MNLSPAEQLSEAFGYLTLGEVRTLRDLADGLNDYPLIVNIGAGSGTSTMAMLEADNMPRVITVDICEEVNPLGGIGNVLDAIERLAPELYGSHTYIVGDSSTIGKEWNTRLKSIGLMTIEKIDMIFIDGDHTYEGCKADIEAWLPHVRNGGIVAFDDYGGGKSHPRQWAGVKKAVDELMSHHKVISVCDSVIAFEVVK